MSRAAGWLWVGVFLALPGLLAAQEVNVQTGGAVRILSGGGITAEGDVAVSGTDTPELQLSASSAAAARLRLGSGGSLTIGNGTNPGLLTASSAGSQVPTITTSGTVGSTHYSFVVDNGATLAVTSLNVISTDANGLTLNAGSVLNNGTAGRLSGVGFSDIEDAPGDTGRTFLRFLHNSGNFEVRSCLFTDAGGANQLYNISTPNTGLAPPTLLVDAYFSNGGTRAGSQYENDRGVGPVLFNPSGSLSTIYWFDEGPASWYSPGGPTQTIQVPMPGSVTYDNNLDLSWSDVINYYNPSVNNVAQYRLYIDDDSNTDFDAGDATPPVVVTVDNAGTPEPSFQNDATPIAAQGWYYWTVEAIDPMGLVGPKCTVINFNIDSPPVPIEPPNGGTIKDSTPTFEWTDEILATSYDLEISTSSAVDASGNFTGPIVRTYVVPDPGFGVTVTQTIPGGDLLPDATYYWHVRADDGANKSAWSTAATPWAFTVDTTVPTLTSPGNGSDVSGVAGVLFTWTGATGAVSYRFQLSRDSGFTDLVYNVTQTGTSITSAPLSAQTYYWRVFAIDSMGFELPSSSFWFNATGSTIGTLSVALGPNSPANSNQLNNATNLSMLQLRFSADPTEDVRINSVVIKASGTGHDVNNVTNVRLYLDTNSNGVYDSGVDTQLGATTAFSADNGNATFSGLSQSIPAGQSRDFLVVYSLNGSAALGATFTSRLDLSTDVNAVGQSSGQTLLPSGTFPINGGTVTIVAGGTGALTVVEGTSTPGDGFVAASENTVEMVQLQLSASSVERVRVTGVRVYASGTGNDAADISNVFLAVDVNGDGIFTVGTDTVLMSGQTYPGDDGIVFFDVNSVWNGTATHPSVIQAGGSANWIVVYDFSGSGSVGMNYQMEVRPSFTGPPAGMTAIGLTSGGSITPSGSTFVGAIKTIGTPGSNEGSLTVANVPLADPEPLDAFEHNVVMQTFTLTAGGLEDVLVRQLNVKASGTGNDVTDVAKIELWEDTDLNGSFSASDLLLTHATPPYTADDGTAQITINRIIPANQTRRWFLTYDFVGLAAAGSTYQVSFDLTDNPSPMWVTGVSSGLAITPIGGQVVGPLVSVKGLQGSSGHKRSSSCLGAASGPREASPRSTWAVCLLVILMLAATGRRWRVCRKRAV